LNNQIVEADGYMPITPEYNHITSAALKNTLIIFLKSITLSLLQLYHILLAGLEELMLYKILEGYLQNLERHLFHHHFQYPKFKIYSMMVVN